MSGGRLRIGVDTGGTFTDLVLIDGEGAAVATHKLLSTPDDPARAVLGGIEALLQGASGEVAQVVHGSTVATNALLEHADARAVLVTTAGFEDVLAIGRQHRPELYALVPRRPEPPIPRRMCLGVDERVGHDGQVITPLTADAVEDVVARLIELKPEAVAVCLLHSYANADHERRLGEAIREALGGGVHLTLSHALLPEHREYERAATCAINAVVAPRMVRYLDRLAEGVGGERLVIMGSHGGTLPVSLVRREPARTVLSGPAGGVLGATAAASAAAVASAERASARVPSQPTPHDPTRIITLDMGGTSTDVALCDRGHGLTSEGEASGGGLPVRLRMVDMTTVGAGGGSIAWVDPGGALRVGPRSAGADPGPACYGRQPPPAERASARVPSHHKPTAHAWLPTVTDAHVVLGHLPTGTPLGSGLTLDADAARAAIAQLADAAGLSVEDAAEGVLRVVEATMAQAVRRVSLQRGHDPRGFTLVPFGGAGGLHAARLADALGMTRVLVPNHPGLLSAVGMLTARGRREFTATLRMTAAPGDPPGLGGPVDVLRRRATRALGEGEWSASWSLDMRYAGQSFDINVPLDVDPAVSAPGADAVNLSAALDAFAAEHRRLYGHDNPDRPVELVALRLAALGPAPVPLQPGACSPRANPPDSSNTFTPRGPLSTGDTLPGPAVITEYSATTLVPQGWRLTVLADGAMELTRDD